jgi:hypothetical protein
VVVAVGDLAQDVVHHFPMTMREDSTRAADAPVATLPAAVDLMENANLIL